MQETGSRGLDVLLIAVLSAILFAWGMEGRRLRKAAEGRVARVAQEMIDDGDWIVPHLGGEVRLRKPPASSWLVALAAKGLSGGRVTTRDALLPPAAAAAALAVLLYLWLSGSGGAMARGAGTMAALALATSPGIVLQARSAEMDMHVALCCALAFWAYEKYRVDGVARALPVTYAALAMGFLVKAHVAILVFLPAVILWEVVERRARRAQEPAPAPAPAAWKLHLIGIAAFLAIVLPWGIPFLMRSGLTWEVFRHEGVERIGEGSGHVEPFYFYFANAPGWAMPWFLLLPFALWMHWRTPSDPRASRRRLWWLWFAVNLVLWSVLTAKQRHYAVPWLTPLCLLAGDGIASALEAPAAEPSRPAWSVWCRRAVTAVGCLAAPAVLTAAAFCPREGHSEAWVWGLAALCSSAFVLGALTIARASRGTGFSARAWWAGAVFALILYAGTWERAEDRDGSPVAFCRVVRSAVPDRAGLYDAGVARPVFLFYLGRNATPVASEEELDSIRGASPDERRAARNLHTAAKVNAILAAKGEDAYVLATGSVLDRVDRALCGEPIAEDKSVESNRGGAYLIRGRTRKD